MAHSPNMAYFFHINFISFFSSILFPFLLHCPSPTQHSQTRKDISTCTCGHKVYLNYSFLSHQIQPTVEFLTNP